jgi:hypothetical protein
MTECTITLDLTRLSEFQHGSLREPVVITENAVRKFSGVVVETLATPRFLVLSCKNSAQHLKELRSAGVDAFEGFTPQEIAYHIVKQTSEISADEKSIHGLTLNNNPRDFLVVVPIFGLELTDPCRISVVDFCKLEPTTDDMKWILERAKEDWGNAKVVAGVKVISTGFFEATAAGREAITKAVDTMSYVSKLSVLGIPTASGPKVIQWERSQLFSRIRPGRETYLRDLTTTTKRWLRSGLTRESVVDFRNRNALPEVMSATFKTPVDDHSRRLSLALRWLRIGNQEQDTTDKLLDLWIALEFIVAKEQIQPTLSGRGFEDLKTAILTSSISDANGTPLSGKAKDTLWLKVQSKVNQVDLRDQFDSFCARCMIGVTEREIEDIWGKEGLRKQRNDLEHGRAVRVDEKQLETMEHVVGKMILGLVESDVGM